MILGRLCWLLTRIFVVVSFSFNLTYCSDRSHDVVGASGVSVAYNSRSFVIDGKPTLLMGGSVHYNRIPPSDWESVILMAKQLGLNCLQTYVMWNAHEPEPGQISFRENLDISRFLSLVAKHKMYAVVRIGPFIGGEYYFGGLPLWLRNKNMSCFRCSDPIWKRQMERWVRIVLAEIEPFLHSELRPTGNVIALQIENEYLKYDDYLQWMVDMAISITDEVPWFICHNVPQCLRLNQEYYNNSTRVLCTINGFWMDTGGGGGQPGPEFMDLIFSQRQSPHQPAMWTEDQGWFDLWGMAHRKRLISDQLYGIARFVATGGSYHNFYMLTGGNNYALTAGRSATTAYALDTAIDSYLLRHEPKFSAFGRFFQTLQQHSEELLSHDPPGQGRPLKTPLGSDSDNIPSSTAEAHEYGNLVFLSNFGHDGSTSDEFVYLNHSYYLPNHTVVLVDTSRGKGAVLFNTSTNEVAPDDPSRPTATIALSNWKSFREGVGRAAKQTGPSLSPEQLNITNNKSDYLWYSFRGSFCSALSIEPFGPGGVFYVYVDGEYRSKIVFPESATVQHTFPSAITESERKRKLKGQDCRDRDIDILSVGMGVNNYAVGPTVGKGIKQVMMDNKTSNAEFTTSWSLLGEALRIFTSDGSEDVEWEQADLHQRDGLVWFQTTFDVPFPYTKAVGGAQPNQTALVVNLKGLNKGVVYINGFLLGRYWLLEGKCDEGCAPPHHGPNCYLHWSHCNEPTQWLYHVPFEVLSAKDNLLTVFEETVDVTRDLGLVRLELIHRHPY